MSTRPTWVVVSHTMLPNGSAHRLVQALLAGGHDVAFCGMPLPGALRWRAEQMLPGSRTPVILADETRRVPTIREMHSALDVSRFARKLAKSGCREVVLVGCDPVASLEAIAAFRITAVRVRASVAWFVDWSAQRLQHPASAAAYRLATRGALRFADVTAAISPPVAQALASMGRQRGAMLVLVNQPLEIAAGRAWTDRPPRVVYTGGLSGQQGVDVLLGAAAALGRDGVPVDIVGDGPATTRVEAAVSSLPGVRFHGLIGDLASLAGVLLGARVGWALYDPSFPMYAFGDSLKIKDYLAAGMRVVSTLPTSVSDGVIDTARLDVASVVDATHRALAVPPVPDPPNHPLLMEASRSLQAFISAVEAVRCDLGHGASAPKPAFPGLLHVQRKGDPNSRPSPLKG